MWHSPNAGPVPDVKFLRTAGIALVVLALGSGVVSLVAAQGTKTQVPMQTAEAKLPSQVVPAEQQARSLEQGAEALFRAVEENVARRHELTLHQLNQQGDMR